MKNLYSDIQRLLASEKLLALATVVRTSGSTPQKPGSSALISPAGIVAGTVGGGVTEARVTEAAINALGTNNSFIFRYELTGDISAKEEAICGGVISVLIEPDLNKHASVFATVGSSLENRIPGVLVTMVTPFSDNASMVNRYWMTIDSKPEIPEDFASVIFPEVDSMLDRSAYPPFREIELTQEGQEPASTFFLEAVFPPVKLVIAGAGHIGRSLAHLGSRLGFYVTVVDDRPEYANSLNIPGADKIIVEDIGAALSKIRNDRDTFVVIVTRGHKDDAAALRQCIGAPLAYTGMIGSRKKLAVMKLEFIEKGWATEEQWNKVYAPIGLEIGSQTVEEIAVSIAAQLIKVRSSL